MAFSLPMVSILMSWISYSAVSAHPFGMFGGGGTPGMSGGMSGLGGGGGMPGFGGGGMPGLGGGGGMSGMADGLGAMSTGIGGAGGASEDKSSSNSIKTELSASCKKAADALSTGELATCANIPALIAISKTEGSIVSAINTWVTGACAAVPCSKDALASAAEKIKKDCQKDLDDGSAPAIGIYSHILHYKEARDTFCTQTKSDSKFCIPSTIEALEAKAGQKFTNAGIKSAMAGKITPEALAFIRVPKEAYCTPCTHALGTQSEIMVEAISKDPKIKFEHSTTQAKGKASEICGASFDDKKIPDSIQIAAPGNGKADAPGGKAKADGPKDTEVAPEKKPKDADASATKPLDAGAGAGAGTETPKDGPTTPENSESTKEATEKPKAEESSSEEA
ncbi:hypothetical protein MJO28_006731 [Puccinia striiformis f. sp. tritici]|uniref:Uncharacterized protein n=1 Tax=Puccinia striiformis f. sp. tritici TaxID=168172 RepID=A0ACC0EJ23_9BASI|nr:hypothetical protein MJO28_006731 [Puccinia striiformis f. sp. tritici]